MNNGTLIGWLGFLSAMVVLFIVSKKNLGVAMFVAAIILGIFLAPENLPLKIWENMINPSTILLAAVVGLIPLIGGVLNESGQMDRLVSNMRIGRKFFLMLSPAIIGLLPMPGGALLSVPLVDKAGTGIPNEKKAGINIWFRHILYLVYPLSADLIVSTTSAEIGLYEPIPYLSVILIFALLLGYIFLLKGDLEKMKYEEEFSPRGLILPLAALLIAPLLDILLKTAFTLPFKELATLIAVSVSLIFAMIIGRLSLVRFRNILVKAKPWDFAFMMIGIMVFLGILKSSGAIELFRNVPITLESLFGIAFLLGFITGRIVTPAGIVFPIYLMKFGSITPPAFALIYFGIFLGYVITPVHPCVSLSMASLKVDFKGYLRAVIPIVASATFLSLLALRILSL